MVELRLSQIPHNFLCCIFAIYFVSKAFIFFVPQALRFFAMSSTDVVSKFFDLQAQKVIFKQKKVKKRSKQENYPLLTADERLVIHLSILFTSDYSSRVDGRSLLMNVLYTPGGPRWHSG